MAGVNTIPTLGLCLEHRSACSKTYPVKPDQTRLNPAKPGQKPGLRHLLTGFEPGSEKHQTPAFAGKLPPSLKSYGGKSRPGRPKTWCEPRCHLSGQRSSNMPPSKQQKTATPVPTAKREGAVARLSTLPLPCSGAPRCSWVPSDF